MGKPGSTRASLTAYIPLSMRGCSGCQDARRPATGVDQGENNMSDDFKGDTTSTGRVTVGGAEVTGDLEVLGDSDWFSIELVAGDRYEFRLEEPTTGAGTLRDPYLYLRDSSGILLDSNDDGGGGLNSLLRFTAPQSDTYWLDARGYRDGYTGTYTLSATRTGSDNDPINLVGTVAADVLFGNAGNDTLDGAAGNDTLQGRGGNDSLVGGAGIDRAVVSGDLDITLSDTQLGGQGIDTLAGIERATLTGGAGDNVIDASDFTRGPVALDGGAGNDGLTGPASAGSFHPTHAHFNRFTGGAGNDTFTGGAGVDAVVEQGDVDFTLGDSRLTGLGTDVLGGIEAALLYGGDGNNRIDASAFTGHFTALYGGAGNDTLVGGAGTDWVSATAIGSGPLTLDAMQLTGQGTDTLDHIDQASLRGSGANNVLDGSGFGGGYVRFDGRGGNDTLIGRANGTDRVHSEGPGDFVLTDDTLTTLRGRASLADIDEAALVGDAGANRFDAAAFTGRLTILEGGGGNDTLVGRDELIDRVQAHGNVDFTLTNTRLTGLGEVTLVDIDEATLVGDGDANVIDASAFTRGTVRLYGESGDDELIGGSGNDRLDGGVGDDTLDGGSGVDRVEGRGDVDFTLTDSELTGLGTDALIGIEQALLVGSTSANVLDASAFTGSLVLLEGRGGDDTLIGRADGIDRVLARGDVDFALTDGELAGLGTDTLTDIDEVHFIGNSGANVFDASAYTGGPVVMRAGAGNDTLLGGQGDDILQGGNGADRLVGGTGADTMNGGAGVDVFAFLATSDSPSEEAQRDLIRDFNGAGGDSLDLSAIDADTTLAGLQTFLPLTEGAAFSGSFSEARALFFDTTTHTLYGNVDADGEADFAINLAGVSSLLDVVFV
jgi:Ca2+-binding RTX toxin-like protein